MVAILLTAPQLIIASVPVVGSPWSGNMHPQNGFPPACDISTPNSCAPSYAELDSARQLWPCPRGDATSDTCGGDGRCVIGEGAVCNNLSSVSPCCCPRVGCRCKHVKGCVSALAFLLRVFSMSGCDIFTAFFSAQPLFNWIIGACKVPLASNTRHFHDINFHRGQAARVVTVMPQAAAMALAVRTAMEAALGETCVL